MGPLSFVDMGERSKDGECLANARPNHRALIVLSRLHLEGSIYYRASPCFAMELERWLGHRDDFRYRELLSVLHTSLIPKARCSGDEKSSGDEQQTSSRE